MRYWRQDGHEDAAVVQQNKRRKLPVRIESCQWRQNCQYVARVASKARIARSARTSVAAHSRLLHLEGIFLFCVFHALLVIRTAPSSTGLSSTRYAGDILTRSASTR